MTTSTKLYKVKPSELRPDWHVIDVADKVLGRISSEIATILQGKRKVLYTRYLMTGDFVVVINASKVRVTGGNKLKQMIYYRHTGYPGGLRQRQLVQMLEKHPERVIQHAVKGMLPQGKLGKHMLRRLKVYGGDTHPHEAQVRGSLKARGMAPDQSADEQKEE